MNGEKAIANQTLGDSKGFLNRIRLQEYISGFKDGFNDCLWNNGIVDTWASSSGNNELVSNALVDPEIPPETEEPGTWDGGPFEYGDDSRRHKHKHR